MFADENVQYKKGITYPVLKRLQSAQHRLPLQLVCGWRLKEPVHRTCIAVSVRSWYVKVKLSPCLTKHHAMKTHWGVEVWLHAFFDLGTRWGWAVSFRLRPFYPQGRSPHTHCTGGWVRSRAEEKNSQSPPGIEPRSSDRPARSQGSKSFHDSIIRSAKCFVKRDSMFRRPLSRALCVRACVRAHSPPLHCSPAIKTTCSA
jgi:hypothetical protein